MQQYFVEQKCNLNELVAFTSEQQHHISHVLRMKADSVVRIVDCDGCAYLAKIQFIQSQPVALVFEKIEHGIHRNVILVPALIKKDKWEYVLQKAAELGATKILPLETSRTVVKSNDEKVDKKLVRWNKIVMEACEQSHHTVCTEVLAPITIKELPNYLVDVNLVAYEKENVSKHIKHYVKGLCDVMVIIGPEGGFDPKEIDLMLSMGIQPCSLGKNILRAETAGLYALSVIDAMSEE
ncbi:MAG: 16S rRNA (uracil(1498)-N(3))-methyltransferase [Erysipelotrichaceae bacterium]|nr:16S rRNA (uracil(1498)-N(3))-methyltransferase [Erysipelotrichaceae bacterium]